MRQTEAARRCRFIPHLELLEDWQTMKINMQYGIVTINEARDARGLPEVPGFHELTFDAEG